MIFPKRLVLAVVLTAALLAVVPRLTFAQTNFVAPALNTLAPVRVTEDNNSENNNSENNNSENNSENKNCDEKPGKECPPPDVPEIGYPVLFLMLGLAVVVGAIVGAAIKHLLAAPPRRKK